MKIKLCKEGGKNQQWGTALSRLNTYFGIHSIYAIEPNGFFRSH